MPKYIPPQKRQLEDSVQKKEWTRLRQSIIGNVNRLSRENLQNSILSTFSLNIIRAQGVLTKALIDIQEQSPDQTGVYAAFASVLNLKIPEIGLLLATRLVLTFRSHYKKNYKIGLKLNVKFIAALTELKVIDELLILQLLLFLLNDNSLTNSLIDLACCVFNDAAYFLRAHSNQIYLKVRDKLRAILVGYKQLDKKTQYKIEALFKKTFEPLGDEFDLVEDQITHHIELDQRGLKWNKSLDVFHEVPQKEYDAQNKEYEALKLEILGDDDQELESEVVEKESPPPKEVITDLTETQLINFQQTVYLTLKSSMSSDEAVHKLLRLDVPGLKTKEGVFKNKLVELIIKLSSLEKSFSKFHALICSKLCAMPLWHPILVQALREYFESAHLYKPNQLRNISKLFGYLLASDVLLFEALKPIELSEEGMTSAQRVMVRVMFEEMVSVVGPRKVMEFVRDEGQSVGGIFPRQGVREWDLAELKERLVFSINFFTAIGLGVLTEDMRDELERVGEEEKEEREEEEEEKEEREEEVKVESRPVAPY